jgi:hypothetical protein
MAYLRTTDNGIKFIGSALPVLPDVVAASVPPENPEVSPYMFANSCK